MMPKKLSLRQQNLIPIYLLQDNLKQNFSQVQQFTRSQYLKNREVEQELNKVNEAYKQMDVKNSIKLSEMEIRIFNNMKQEMQGTVTAVLDRQLGTLLQKLRQGEEKYVQKQEQLKKKLQLLQKKLSFQITKQNQKYFTKEIGKIQDQIDKKIQSISYKAKMYNASNANQHKRQNQNHSNQKQKMATSLINKQPNSLNASQLINKEALEQLRKKVQKLQQFSTSIDKRFVTNFSNLKENWKQLGTQLLDNKKFITKKVQELNMEFYKIKNLSQFSNMPQALEQSLKMKIMDKFSDLYKMISSLATKSQFQMNIERLKKTLSRHEEQLIEIREQLAQNNQYFTFYMNNSKTDDIKESINSLRSDFLDDKKYINSMFQDILDKSEKNKKYIQQVVQTVGGIEVSIQNTADKFQKIHTRFDSMNQKFIGLEDPDHLSPKKMKIIHETLDFSHNFAETQPNLNSIQKVNNSHNKMLKQMRKQMQRLKDQMLSLASQKNMNGVEEQDEIFNIRNQIKTFNHKLERMKNQSEEALISRKPWVCMSCDKQKIKQKNSKYILQRESSRKKISLDTGKGGGFLTNRSSDKKMIPNVNTAIQQRFQVYEKYRQKYLSNTSKLPEIFKQKILSEQNLLR